MSYFDMSDAQYNAMTPAQRQKAADDEILDLLRIEALIEAGLAFRRAGLIYFLPLCHDAYGEGNP